MQKDIRYFREEYALQQKLERIVKSRILVRPNVKKWQVAISFAILPFLLFVAVVFPLITNLDLGIKISILTVAVIIVIELYLRFCLILAVKCYQACAKEETRRRCKCIPSCSEYAILALKKVFPVFIALLKIRKRLFVTCDGDGYKIDFPTKKMEKDFEDKLR